MICGIGRADTISGGLKFVDGKLPKTEERIIANPVRAMVFNIMWYDGEAMWEKPYKVAIHELMKIFPPEEDNGTLYHPVIHNNICDAATLRQRVQASRKTTEGIVVWDITKSCEVGFTGKPNRRACYKCKATQETDVVVYKVEEGKGKRQGKVATLYIGAYDEDGNIVELGKCGSGITDESAEPSFWNNLPCVVQIEYAEQFDTGKYQFPVFICKHGDKKPKEVTM